jgi:hypothetical protein
MQSKEKNTTNEKSQTVPARPNESGQLHLDDFVKIFDPNNQEVLLEKRA